MPDKVQILVTGEPDERPGRFPTEAGGRALEWIQVPVLRFERLPVERAVLDEIVATPPEWIVFTSQRSVAFWSETLMEAGLDFPIETQVACIGEATADSASADGYSPDFYPTEPGTEKFLEEFAELVSNNLTKPTVFIPMAEGGRPLLREKLEEMGCKVTILPLYRTIGRDDIAIAPETLERASLLLFTSPSSVEALTRRVTLPPSLQLASIGQFTADCLRQKGYTGFRVLPGGDFHRVGEIL